MADLTQDALRSKLVPADAFTEATAGGLRLLVKRLSAADFLATQKPLVELAQKESPTEDEKDRAAVASQLATVRRAAYTADRTPLLDGMTDDEVLSLESGMWAELLGACYEHSGLSKAKPEEAAKN